MTQSEAERVIGGSLAIEGDSGWKNCGYTPTAQLPPGVHAMVEDGRIARIEVNDGTVPTAEGARIGDSEDRIRQLYPGGVVTTPHKYTSGHYLTVTPSAPSDSLYRLIFETDGARVTRFRAGRLPPVAYVEGCG
ncbi:MAG TPA: hypothetical protein VHB25_20570 [Gemmatimonadaceae bacterium]|nr:hypothetical protein [Gemmatimonadaceae bacterium]